MTSAPADGPTLLAFLAPPPGRILPGGGEGDTTREVEPKTPTTNQQPPQNSTPSFSLPDTSHGRASRSFPGGDSTALETLGPGSPIHTFPGGGTAATPSGAHAPRGFFGITPIAILVGLIALHVFIVSAVGK